MFSLNTYTYSTCYVSHCSTCSTSVNRMWFVCVCVCVHLVTQSCPTLCDPMDYSLPGSSVHRILQARILEGFQSFLQGIFPIQGSNSGRVHCRQSQECVWNTTIENSGFMSLDMKNRGRISAHPYVSRFSNYSPKRHSQPDH